MPLCVLLCLLAVCLAGKINIAAGENVTSYVSCPGVEHEDGSANVYVGVLLDKPEVPSKAWLGRNGELYVTHSEMAQVVLRQAEAINLNATVLPDHALCLHIVFVAANSTDAPYKDVLAIFRNPYVPLIVNSLFNKFQSIAHVDYLVPFFPMALVRSPHVDMPSLPHPVALFDVFVKHDYSSNACDAKLDIVLDLLPPQNSLFGALDVLVHHYGWERFGLLIEDDSTYSTWPGDADVFWSVYDPNDFITSFKPFNDNEIRVFVYIGSFASYLRLMLKAHEMGVQ